MKNVEHASSPEESKIVIKTSREAPAEVKRNPFYDPEFWGRADSFDDIYIPDSDDALSLALAAHELGHLVTEGEAGEEATLDNFTATKAEEQRAWEKGWPYIQSRLAEYCGNDPELVPEIESRFSTIRDLAMEAVEASRGMYVAEGELPSDEPYSETLQHQREQFANTPAGQKILHLIGEIKNQRLGREPDWERLSDVVRQAAEEILRDNEKHNNVSV